MGGISIWHIIVFLLVLAFFVVPVVKIVKRAGFSGWWCLLLLVPFVNWVMLYVFAFSRWPNMPENSN